MTTQETPAMETLIIPRPVNEKAVRRWINEQYDDGTSCATWTLEECLAFVRAYHVRGLEAFRQADYTATPVYLAAPARARATIDAVFHAVRNVASPDLGLQENPDGLSCVFTWHDGAQYRVRLTHAGVLARLFRLELTGAWVWDELEGREVPEDQWRTVRAFSRDRAGKVLGAALADVPAAAPWVEASAR